LIPKIPQLSLGIPKGQAAKSGANYDHRIEVKFSFICFGRSSFHYRVTKQYRRQTTNYFLTFMQQKLFCRKWDEVI
jgi:hypothetical protein